VEQGGAGKGCQEPTNQLPLRVQVHLRLAPEELRSLYLVAKSWKALSRDPALRIFPSYFPAQNSAGG
jgi:hypothetical protein